MYILESLKFLNPRLNVKCCNLWPCFFICVISFQFSAHCNFCSFEENGKKMYIFWMFYILQKLHEWKKLLCSSGNMRINLFVAMQNINWKWGKWSQFKLFKGQYELAYKIVNLFIFQRFTLKYIVQRQENAWVKLAFCW